jgi:hypothetical protein
MSALLFIFCAVVTGDTDVIPPGAAKLAMDLGGRTVNLYTYKPASYRNGPMLMVFHGVDRNAEEYRDDARGLGDRHAAIVVAPEFDRKQFPAKKYQHGGLRAAGAENSVTPRAEWTWSLVPQIALEIRRREGRADMPYYLIGHSAGGQFVGRLAGFVESDARRILVANPSSYLFPSSAVEFPYGFGGLPGELSDEQRLRRYLAQPLTIYLGTKDNERDDDLDTSPEADLQGNTRLERGRKVFDAARRLARDKGWEFRWTLVEAEDVGHDHRKMFDAPACDAALFGVQRIVGFDDDAP